MNYYASDKQMVETIIQSCICVRADVGHAVEIARMAARLPGFTRGDGEHGSIGYGSVVPSTVRPLLEQGYQRAQDVLLFKARREADMATEREHMVERYCECRG